MGKLGHLSYDGCHHCVLDLAPAAQFGADLVELEPSLLHMSRARCCVCPWREVEGGVVGEVVVVASSDRFAKRGASVARDEHVVAAVVRVHVVDARGAPLGGDAALS